MKLRKLVVDDAFEMAIEAGCEIRLIPRDHSRFDEIMLEFSYGGIHLSYANGTGSLTIYKTNLWEFEKELQQQFDLDTEDWVVSADTLAELEEHISKVQKFIELAKKDRVESK